MPNIQSARKNLRKSSKRRIRNVAAISTYKTLLRKFREQTDNGEVEAAKATYALYCSSVDKAAKTGKLKKNTAIRGKTRAANLLRKKMASPAPAAPAAAPQVG